MTERRAPTLTMKLESLYALGQIRCAVCAERLTEAETQWDHVHALVLDGPDVGTNLRPLHIACHQRITARLARDLGHGRGAGASKEPSRQGVSRVHVGLVLRRARAPR